MTLMTEHCSEKHFQEISPETLCVTEGDVRKALKDLYDPSVQLPNVIFVDINMPRTSGWDCLMDY
jgi:CheY-like chemotaxis protein